MKNIILSIFFLITVSRLIGQGYIKNIPVHTDYKLIDSLNINTIKQKADTVCVFITQINNVDLTFLFWLIQGQMYVIKVTDSTVSKVEKVKFGFHKTLDLKKLAITVKEDKLKFIPPITHSKECDVFIFYKKDKSFLIEAGHSSRFVLDKAKKKYRLLFVKSIKHELSQNIINWKVATSYKRYE